MDLFGPADIIGILTGQGKFRQPQRVGPEGGGLTGRDQFIGRCHRVRDIGGHLQEQVLAQGGLLRPVLDIGAHLQLIFRLGLAPAVINTLLIHAAVKMIIGGGIIHIQIRSGGQPASIDSCRRDRPGIHKGDGRHLAFTGQAWNPDRPTW